MSSNERSGLEKVHGFWNTEACGTHFVAEYRDDEEFYRKFREHRYRTEWHLPLLVPFADTRGQSILEIGTGNGADGAMFAQNGAHYTGVDLTEAALTSTRKHFGVLGLEGTFQKENAESLSFGDGTFDLVYSHGVLHHTPRTQRAIDEVYRVLKPGGRAVVMLYHKRSFNYAVRIMSYMRLRVLGRILGRVGHWKADRARASADSLVGVRGNEDQRIWDIHYQNFLRHGWSYLQAQNFVHHCTDGPECPVAYAFNKKEAGQLFSRFENVHFAVAHFPMKKYRLGKWVPWALERFLAARIGWYLFIFASKPRPGVDPH